MLHFGNKQYKHKNTIELRRLMIENHLRAKQVAEMIHRSHGAVRTYMSEGSIIKDELLWMLKRKIQDMKTGENSGFVSISNTKDCV
jgi:predicted transcriptional regulator